MEQKNRIAKIDLKLSKKDVGSIYEILQIS